MYSWITCDYYIYDWSQTDCSIKDIKFPYCSATSGTPGSQETLTCSNGWWYPWDCTFPLSLINTQKPWYFSPNNCGDDQFRQNVWTNLFNTYTSNSQRNLFLPYIFCYKYNGTITTYDGYCNYDIFYWVFEQDCTNDPDKGLYFNWMIIKFATTTLQSVNINAFPDEAAYFGERDGDTIAYAISIDELGYIYISGTSNAVRNGATGTAPTPSNEQIWIYARTHWELHYEATFEQTSDVYTGVTEFLSKRFTQPLKSTNNDGVIFTYDFLTTEASTSGGYAVSSLAINEDTFALSLFVSSGGSQLHNFQTDFPTIYGYNAYVLGTGQQALGIQSPIWVTVTPDTQSVEIPNVCLSQQTFFNAGNTTTNDWRGQYYAKGYTVGPSVAGLSLVIPSSPSFITGQNKLEGVVTGSEGIYRTWIMGNPETYGFNVNGATLYYQCPQAQQAYFWDYPGFPALQRMQTAERIRVFVDDVAIPPPQIKSNIPDATPCIGQRYQIDTISQYFTTTCTYYKAKMSRVLSYGNPSYTDLNTTMLPYWIVFYEQNTTIVMYPVDLNVTNMQIYCCNALQQCAINTFSITPYDNAPTDTFDTAQTTIQTIQYDAYNGVGQYFDWSETALYFQDTDTTTDSLDTAYHHTDHTVWVTFDSFNYPYFDQIQWMGLLFGQAFTGDVGTLTFTYQYQDQYSDSNIPTLFTSSFKIIVNIQPSPTATGLAYSFSDIDPCSFVNTTYFNNIFPFLPNQTYPVLNITTATWWTSSQTLTYALTMSDGTDRPDWIGYDITSGILRGYPNLTYTPAYLNLKFTAYDTNSGTYSYYKTLLVDCAPETQVIYKTLYLSTGDAYGWYIGDYITDADEDYLTWSLVYSANQTDLRDIGLDFYTQKQLIAGTPVRSGIWSPIAIQATDPYGKSAVMYLTINVQDYHVALRTNVPMYQNQVVTAGMYFAFVQSNEVFFDLNQGGTLVMFASTPAGEPLPSWLHFDPVSYCFYGVAPYPETLKIQLTGMNQISQEYESAIFTLTVLPNSNPITQVQYIPNDVTTYQGNWVDVTLSRLLFYDFEVNRQATIEMLGGYGQPVPDWLSFNPDNRSVYGLANETGAFRLDFVYTDDGGLKTYSNLLITVLPVQTSATDKARLPINYFLSCSFIVGLCIFMIYSLQFSFQIQSEYQKKEKKLVAVSNSQRRFSKYQDIEVFYHHLKKNEQIGFIEEEGSRIPNTVRTFDRKIDKAADISSNISMLYNGEGANVTHDYIEVDEQQNKKNRKRVKVVE